jgi:hypothetical protein
MVVRGSETIFFTNGIWAVNSAEFKPQHGTSSGKNFKEEQHCQIEHRIG